MLITGAERERELVEATVRELDAPSFIGTTSLAEFAALIDSAAVVVCGNTLPLHLADALGTPLVLLYSGTDLVSQWKPRSVPHRLLRRDTPCTPCYRFDCPIGQPCLQVRPQEIVEAVLDLLQHVQPADQHHPMARTSVGVAP